MKKICERLLLNNAELNFSSIYLKTQKWVFLKMVLNIRRKTVVPESFLINIVAGLQLKPIFIQKEIPALVFSRQLSEILATTFLTLNKP